MSSRISTKELGDSFFRAASACDTVNKFSKAWLVSREIRATQLEKAIAWKPDLVSLIAGGNDVLEGHWNHLQYREGMEFIIQQIKNSADVQIITSTLPDFTLRLPLSSEKKQMIKSQSLQANEIIQSLSEQYNLCLIDFWNHSLSKDPTIWSRDGIHPNSVVYREIGLIVYKCFKQWVHSRS